MKSLHFIFFSLELSLILRATAINVKDSYVKHDSNSTKPNLESADTNIKTATPIEIASLIYSEENTPKERGLDGFLELVTHTHPIQNAFFKYFTNIYSYDCKTKTLILNGDASSKGFSLLAYNMRKVFSNSIVNTLIFKNLAIGRVIFETITFFLNCYQDTLEVLIFDHCFFSPNFAINGSLQLTSLHTAKIIYCALNPKILNNMLAVFPCSLQTLELSHLCINSSIDKYKHFGKYLTLDFSFLNVNRFTQLKSFAVKRNDISKFRFENFTNLEEFECDKLFKSYHLLNKFYMLIASITDEISDLSIFESNLSELNFLMNYRSYLLNAFYMSAELVTTESDDLLNQISDSMTLVKEKCSEVYELQREVNYHSDNLNEVQSKFSELFEEISKLQGLLPQERPKLSDKLKQLRNLKRIKTGEYVFKDDLNYFVEENIVVDSDSSVAIFPDDLPNIPSILSTFTNVYFYLTNFTSDDIYRITLENESKFKHLKSVTFYDIKNTSSITFIIWILNLFHGIRTITFELFIKNITVEQITESFNNAENYDNIENVHFTYFSRDTFVTCEFMIQILKRVPNLKSLSFIYMEIDVIDMLFNRLQKEQLKFPNLKKISINDYDGSINILLWLIQTFPIEELDILTYKLSCDSSELLDNFSSKTLKKLCITRAVTNNYDLLKKCFSNTVNLKELHIHDFNLINLFENNSTIEKVTFQYERFGDENSEMVFAILKTFKSLKCIYVRFYERSHSYVISAFQRHFKGREVELIFYSELFYFL